MKKYIICLLKKIIFQTIFLLLIFGGILAYAITFSDAPTGETPGGKFMDYFSKMLVTTGSTNTGVVKYTDVTYKLKQGLYGDI